MRFPNQPAQLAFTPAGHHQDSPASVISGTIEAAAARKLVCQTMMSELKILQAGRHISLVARGKWEYAMRNTQRPAVGIVAITDDEKVVLVEQFRPAVEQSLIELPAGLAGDIVGAEQESLLIAAQRELLEETGYVAGRWTEILSGYSSPGITDELIVLFLAEGLTRQTAGGGDGHENTTLHEVPLQEVLPWLAARGAKADLKLLAGLYAALECRGERST